MIRIVRITAAPVSGELTDGEAADQAARRDDGGYAEGRALREANETSGRFDRAAGACPGGRRLASNCSRSRLREGVPLGNVRLSTGAQHVGNLRNTGLTGE